MPPPVKRPSASLKRPAAAGCSGRPHKKPAAATLEDAPTSLDLQQFLKSCGLAKDKRMAQPAPFTSGGFAIDKTLQRKAAFGDLFSAWKRNFDTATQREKLPLVAVPAAPGTGKTRFAWLAAAKGVLPGKSDIEEEWEEAFNNLVEDSFQAGLKDAVGVTVTFNYKTEPLASEEIEDMVGVRMLYSHFCKNEGEFSEFHADLQVRGWDKISPARAVEIIRNDIGADQHMVLVVDEPMRVLAVNPTREQSRLQLGRLTTGLGRIINDYSNVHILITSLSATVLTDSLTPASGRALHWVDQFELFEPTTVQSLVDQYSKEVQEVLKTKQFQAILGECLGLPRLLETVIEVATTDGQQPELSCAALREKVLQRYGILSKYGDGAMRAAALVAAFSVSSAYTETEARQQKTIKAEISGYLVKSGKSHAWAIPPILLSVWQKMHNDLESRLLLGYASSIYYLSETTSSAEHFHRFEKQLGYLYQLRSVVDAIQRRDQPREHQRTVVGMLGLLPADHPPLPANSAFNRPLADVVLTSFTVLPCDMPDCVGEMVPGTIYLPKSGNPGFDVALVENTVAETTLLILIEARFSSQTAQTKLSGQIIESKLANALKMPGVQDHFDSGTLCFIVGGWRHCAQPQSGLPMWQEVSNFAQGGASFAGRVRQSLLVLTREWTGRLLTPTLASLPPFC